MLVLVLLRVVLLVFLLSLLIPVLFFALFFPVPHPCSSCSSSCVLLLLRLLGLRVLLLASLVILVLVDSRIRVLGIPEFV